MRTPTAGGSLRLTHRLRQRIAQQEQAFEFPPVDFAFSFGLTDLGFHMRNRLQAVCGERRTYFFANRGRFFSAHHNIFPKSDRRSVANRSASVECSCESSNSATALEKRSPRSVGSVAINEPNSDARISSAEGEGSLAIYRSNRSVVIVVSAAEQTRVARNTLLSRLSTLSTEHASPIRWLTPQSPPFCQPAP